LNLCPCIGITPQYERCAVPVPHRFHRFYWISQISSYLTDEVDSTDSINFKLVGMKRSVYLYSTNFKGICRINSISDIGIHLWNRYQSVRSVWVWHSAGFVYLLRCRCNLFFTKLFKTASLTIGSVAGIPTSVVLLPVPSQRPQDDPPGA